MFPWWILVPWLITRVIIQADQKKKKIGVKVCLPNLKLDLSVNIFLIYLLLVIRCRHHIKSRTLQIAVKVAIFYQNWKMMIRNIIDNVTTTMLWLWHLSETSAVSLVTIEMKYRKEFRPGTHFPCIDWFWLPSVMLCKKEDDGLLSLLLDWYHWTRGERRVSKGNFLKSFICFMRDVRYALGQASWRSSLCCWCCYSWSCGWCRGWCWWWLGKHISFHIKIFHRWHQK